MESFVAGNRGSTVKAVLGGFENLALHEDYSLVLGPVGPEALNTGSLFLMQGKKPKASKF